MSKQIDTPKFNAEQQNYQGTEGQLPAKPTQVAEPVPQVDQVVNGRSIKGE